MSQEDIRIEYIKTSQLVEFADKFLEAAKEGQFIPITKQRAIAHSRNPFCDPEDVSLLVAYDQDDLVGYFGIMPIMLKLHDALEKVYWFTTWRVSPQLRGKSVGSLLMQKALELKYDFLIVGSGPARRVCKKFGFWEREPLVYYQIDLTAMDTLNPALWISRLARKILKPFRVKVDIANKFTRSTARFFSFFTRPFLSWYLWKSWADNFNEFSLKEVEEVRQETKEQLVNKPDICLYRDWRVINWMLKYPWVLAPGASPTEKMDYYFSDVRGLFKNFAYEVYSNKNEYLGYIVLMVTRLKDGVVIKVLDYSFNEKSSESCILPIASQLARTYQANLIILPEVAVDSIYGSIFGKIALRRKDRIYQCYPKAADSPLALAWEKLVLDFCDGDMAFS